MHWRINVDTSINVRWTKRNSFLHDKSWAQLDANFRTVILHICNFRHRTRDTLYISIGIIELAIWMVNHLVAELYVLSAFWEYFRLKFTYIPSSSTLQHLKNLNNESWMALSFPISDLGLLRDEIFVECAIWNVFIMWGCESSYSMLRICFMYSISVEWIPYLVEYVWNSVWWIENSFLFQRRKREQRETERERKKLRMKLCN